jgi:hypothetical protein
MSNARKNVAQNVTLCRKRTLSIYKHATYLRNSMQKFFESHETNPWGASSIRVQPERRAALGQSEIFKKNPAVAAAGP